MDNATHKFHRSENDKKGYGRLPETVFNDGNDKLEESLIHFCVFNDVFMHIPEPSLYPSADFQPMAFTKKEK